MELKPVIFVILILAAITRASVHRIGARIHDDQLLINDTLYERTKSELPTNHSIEFEYSVNKLVSYIEVSSNSNVHTQFGLTNNNILYGVVTAIEVPEFEVKIRIFGIDKNKAPPHFYPVLTPDRHLQKMVEHFEYEDDDEYYETENIDDNIIDLGERQRGDELVYEIYQHSHASEKPENHSVIFYYIDSYYLTYAEFVTIHTSSATATYSQVSDHSIKAVIYNENVHSLDVKLTLYGYQPNEKPFDFKPMLSIDNHNDPQVFKPECPPLALIQISNTSENLISNLLFVITTFLFSFCLIA